MSRNELILMLCEFSLWCQANPWQGESMGRFYKGLNDETSNNFEPCNLDVGALEPDRVRGSQGGLLGR